MTSNIITCNFLELRSNPLLYYIVGGRLHPYASYVNIIIFIIIIIYLYVLLCDVHRNTVHLILFTNPKLLLLLVLKSY